MLENSLVTATFEALLEPREDRLSFDIISELLPKVIDYVVEVGCNDWDKNALSQLSHDIRSNNIALTSHATRGSRGIHGDHPIHGALIKIAEAKQDELEKKKTSATGLCDRCGISVA